MPEIEGPERVPVKSPIPGELQLTALPATVQPVMVDEVKQGEPVKAMVPEKSLPGRVTVMEIVPDEMILLLFHVPCHDSLRSGDAKGLFPDPPQPEI